MATEVTSAFRVGYMKGTLEDIESTLGDENLSDDVKLNYVWIALKVWRKIDAESQEDTRCAA